MSWPVCDACSAGPECILLVFINIVSADDLATDAKPSAHTMMTLHE